MASRRNLATIENLPNEVLSDIFIQLIAKQLAQMRCVCKDWNALLSDSSFVKSHLLRSIHHNDEILLFFREGLSFDFSSFTARLSHSPDLELTNFIKPPFNPQSKDIRGGIIGSVNGLICYYYKSYDDDDYVVHVCNPSLSAMLTLPPCLVPFNKSSEVHFRFGFDPKTDDYKLVKLTSYPRESKMAPQAEVYSMRKGTWELISQRFPSHVTIISTRDEVCTDGHDGHCHWLGYTDVGWKKETIVAFDLNLETFRMIPLPDSVVDYYSFCMNVMNAVGVLSGKLCVMSKADLDCEVWVMDEYGVAESWVKHHEFSQFFFDIYPYGFTSHGEYLFHAPNDRFALYDPIAEKCKTFKIMGGQLGIIKVVGYVDSLVWVAPAKR
ncbi:hypothetical protein Lser_V15G36526 [Lactuca serriola]